jgi:hypothetical protein
MIEKTLKKLQEAKFFLARLKSVDEQMFANEPESFEFYLSAFLSAARSVTFVLQREEKDKYDAWFPGWSGRLSEEERAIMTFFKDERNASQKEGSSKATATWDFIPVTKIKSDYKSGRHPIYGWEWFGPPGTPVPEVGVRKYSFETEGEPRKVTEECQRYLDILERLVTDFIRAQS